MTDTIRSADVTTPVSPDQGQPDQQDPAPVMLPGGLWERLTSDPQYAPEHLALEAVARMGPAAQVWAQQARLRHPDRPSAVLAQRAVARFVNLARLSGAVSGVAGLPGAVADMGVLAWTQASMVLHIAAAYGVDPTDPERATDLLVLQGIHKYAAGARTALEVAAGRERVTALIPRGTTSPVRACVQLGLKLAQMAGVRAAKRLFAKAVPGAAVILGTLANSSATKDLAKRATDQYQTLRKHPLAAGPTAPPSVPGQRFGGAPGRLPSGPDPRTR